MAKPEVRYGDGTPADPQWMQIDFNARIAQPQILKIILGVLTG
jgi:hypothetical protein